MATKLVYELRNNSPFHIHARKLKSEGKLKKPEDATQRLWFTLLQEHIDNAVPKDQTHCVLGQGLMGTQADSYVMSVSKAGLVKMLNIETGRVIRYMVPSELKGAIKEFDKTGHFRLPPGRYYLEPPKGRNMLTRNQDEVTRNRKREQDRKRWEKHKERQKRGENNGTGFNVFRGLPLPEREITIIR